MLRQAQTDPSGSLGDLPARLAGVMDEIALRGSLRALCAERLQLRAALTRHFGIEGQDRPVSRSGS